MLTGFGGLLRVALEGERRRTPVTVAAFVAIFLATSAQLATLAPTLAEREALRTTVSASASFTLLLGPFEHPETVASTTSWRIGLFMAGALAVLAALTVVRHTRREEESGRLELVRAARVGRLASLAAAVTTALLMVVVTAGASAVTLLPRDASGAQALAFAVALAVPALVAIGLAAVASEVATTGRAASGLAVGIVLAGYVVRGVADVRGWDVLAAAEPFGWSVDVDPFGEVRWIAAVPALVVTVLLVAAAALLARDRDLGAGLLAVRAGRPGSTRLTGPVPLALRLERSAFLGWAAVLALFGAFVGSVLPSLGEVAGSNPQFQRMLEQLGGEGALVDAFLVTMSQFFSVAVACWTLSHLGTLVAQEARGPVEAVLATGVSRPRLLLGHVVLGFAGAVVLELVVALGVGTQGPAGDALAAFAVHLPAVWLLAAVGALVLGGWPQHWWVAWAVLILSAVAGVFGDLLGLPGWVQDLSVLSHVPAVPTVDPDWAPLLTTTAAAVVVTAAAVVLHRRRDVPAAARARRH